MIQVRNARREDAWLVGWTMLTALGIPPEEFGNKDFVWEREDSLYSWTRSRIVEVDGKPAGCLISYPGEEYAPLRIHTWEMIFGETSEDADRYESETFPGEYYLDSMALLPEYRGLELGRMLLEDGVRKGQEMGYSRITLIVEVDRPKLKSYYTDIGFKAEGTMSFFGHDYTRMVYNRI